MPIPFFARINQPNKTTLQVCVQAVHDFSQPAFHSRRFTACVSRLQQLVHYQRQTVIIAPPETPKQLREMLQALISFAETTEGWDDWDLQLCLPSLSNEDAYERDLLNPLNDTGPAKLPSELGELELCKAFQIHIPELGISDKPKSTVKKIQPTRPEVPIITPMVEVSAVVIDQ